MEFPKELYQPKTLVTLGGASLAVVIVGGVAGHVFGFNPKWFGLLVAQVLAFVGLTQVGAEYRQRKAAYITAAVINGALIYSQAVGLNALNHAVPSGDAEHAALIPDSVVWWTPADQRAAAEEMARTAEEAHKTARSAAATVESLTSEVETLRKNGAESLEKLRACEQYVGALLASAERPEPATQAALAKWREQKAQLQLDTKRIGADLLKVPAVRPEETRRLAQQIQRTENRLKVSQQTLQQAYSLER
jgi:hypothetical protein